VMESLNLKLVRVQYASALSHDGNPASFVALSPISDQLPKIPQLSLYITSLMLEFAHADYESSATMMAAIKCQHDRAGERGARTDWAWEFWQDDWTFRQESEVWGT
jgi:hypothetical protein